MGAPLEQWVYFQLLFKSAFLVSERITVWHCLRLWLRGIWSPVCSHIRGQQRWCCLVVRCLPMWAGHTSVNLLSRIGKHGLAGSITAVQLQLRYVRLVFLKVVFDSRKKAKHVCLSSSPPESIIMFWFVKAKEWWRESTGRRWTSEREGSVSLWRAGRGYKWGANGWSLAKDVSGGGTLRQEPACPTEAQRSSRFGDST